MQSSKIIKFPHRRQRFCTSCDAAFDPPSPTQPLCQSCYEWEALITCLEEMRDAIPQGGRND